ncbi:MAG: triose-phosphate isomerase [Chitinophagia bacterium]|nr:triose-phosphate isomerase [Chitinophagia bacterium]
MRKNIVAANWKMNLNMAEGTQLVTDILAGLPALNDQNLVVIAPPFTMLREVAQLLNGQPYVSASAQNCYTEKSGAFTGEVSAAMVKDAGAGYVILGHSERREYAGETSEILVKKIDQALANGLKVIFCCGEPLAVRDAGTENAFVGTQIEEALSHLTADQMADITIAYEPIWAIGTGRTATSAQAQDMHAHIRGVLRAKFGADVANDTPILYGGSCKPSNAAELFACPDVDGGLIGGASLKADEFLAIINARVSA